MSIELVPKAVATAEDVDTAHRAVVEFAEGRMDLPSAYQAVASVWAQPALYMALYLESNPHDAWKERYPALLDTESPETQVAGHPGQLEAAISSEINQLSRPPQKGL
jgi:hypothetical protein